MIKEMKSFIFIPINKVIEKYFESNKPRERYQADTVLVQTKYDMDLNISLHLGNISQSMDG